MSMVGSLSQIGSIQGCPWNGQKFEYKLPSGFDWSFPGLGQLRPPYEKSMVGGLRRQVRDGTLYIPNPPSGTTEPSPAPVQVPGTYGALYDFFLGIFSHIGERIGEPENPPIGIIVPSSDPGTPRWAAGSRGLASVRTRRAAWHLTDGRDLVDQEQARRPTPWWMLYLMGLFGMGDGFLMKEVVQPRLHLTNASTFLLAFVIGSSLGGLFIFAFRKLRPRR